MTQRLPVVLSAADLPLAELLAARLDGELFRVDDCFAPVDEIEQPRHRAEALRAGLPERLIAEQHSAAWIWGALDTPPRRHELCVAMGARVSHVGVTRSSVREVVIEPWEIETVGGMRVTNPLRTVVDLARFSATFGDSEERISRWLALSSGFGFADCIDDLNRRRNLPNKRQAAERLRAIRDLPSADRLQAAR